MAPADRPRPPRSRVIAVFTVILVAAVVIVVAAVRHPAAAPAADKAPSHAVSSTPLTLASTSPTAGAIGVADDGAIVLTFSAPIRSDATRPSISPSIDGTWDSPAPDELRFTPTAGFLPLSKITVTVPAGTSGPVGQGDEVLAAPATLSYSTAPGSTLRLQQLLAELDYLPVAFTPTGTPTSGSSGVAGSSGTVTSTSLPTSSEALSTEPTDPAAISLSPRDGTFGWRFSNVPAQLQAAFSAGQWGTATLGAVMAFQSEHGLRDDGSAGPLVWTALLQAVASRAVTSRPYDYVIATETDPETLYVWREGSVILQTPTNSGVEGAATALGTFPVYLKYTSTTMKGTNPDGTHYSDPGVPWVSYFNGSDAVHGFPRAGYGYPQSDGCLEIPISTAAQVYPLDPIGTLVTVTTGALSTQLGAAPPSYIAPPAASTTTTAPTTTTSTSTTTTTTTAPRRTTTTTAVPTTTVAPTTSTAPTSTSVPASPPAS